MNYFRNNQNFARLAIIKHQDLVVLVYVYIIR